MENKGCSRVAQMYKDFIKSKSVNEEKKTGEGETVKCKKK